MKITVLGAGAIGSAVAYDLARTDAVTRVQVCEARPITLRAFRTERAHPKVRTYEADARDTQTLEPILAGSAVVVSCVGPEHSARLARLSLALGAHFVDLADPDALCDAEAALAAEAEQRQRWVVMGCGLAPGLVGVLVMCGIEALAEATAARIRVGGVPEERGEPYGHRLAHSAEKLLDDYTAPAPVLRDGALETRPPLTGVEAVEVRGFGTMEAFYTSAGLRSLATALEGRLDRLDAKMLRYPGHADRMRFLLDLGLADKTSLDVRTHLTYRDVLVRRLRQRLGGPYRDAVLLRVEVDGRRADGEAGTLAYSLVARPGEEAGLSAMQRCTGFPASVAALLLAQRGVPGGGAGAAEQVLPPEPFVEGLVQRGLQIEEQWAPRAVAEPA
ncbi:saccharopine dehydrogenase C-terminal domain-containing protein [Rubrivirga sp. S365]|uniref:Saccharopine dehydrogenase C-terminal domain-containing protein n=1 Tax=Rubrivirga litoralis TaxID=3075598 RepID=A0ABU3BT07_9BACT|nr:MULTISPECIES: saccharopine dehydrogenase C-terminal domain-containing protein [unclassified Rubrivirga]MDT0632419.1 saccharopine dehydrogenase C-terminal domain-containing protein [Rubrivirga sp. F394]MDT7855210.1 saccharopine dehydrogenase C-terminal domain-containing protein [Rubrivirga sp. S365]